MKKMYYTTEIKKNDYSKTIPNKKGRVQFTTCKGGQYSYYTKAVKKTEKKLKYLLKRVDIDTI